MILVLFSLLTIIATSHAACSDTQGNSCDFCLTSADFVSGTYRITQSGTYCVTEDLIFNPHPGTLENPNRHGKWFPVDHDAYPGSQTLTGGPFALGFFAMISIETSNVKLDLVDHTIAMHQYFYIQQRFFTLIEIANLPFFPGNGPNDFGSDLISVNNVEICYGTLGLSSHQGIHANNASSLTIHDLHIQDFEVAGIQLNGLHDVTIYNMNIGPSASAVTIYGQYSQARYVLQAFRKLLMHADPNSTVSFMAGNRTLEEIYFRLEAMMDISFRAALNLSTITDRQHELNRISRRMFINDCNQLPHGSAMYGIVLNSYSFAVNGFGDDDNGVKRPEGTAKLSNIHIHDLKIKVSDVPALYMDRCDGDMETQTITKGPFGDIMDVQFMVDRTQKPWLKSYEWQLEAVPFADAMLYVGNPLADAQVALYRLDAEFGFGYFSQMHDEFLAWTTGKPWPTECARFVCNGDLMFHSNKGIVGLRIDGLEKTELEGIVLERLTNRSPLANNACKDFNGVHDGGSAGWVDQQGAMDSDLRGISVVDGDLVIRGKNKFEALKSLYGDCIGIDVLADASLEIEKGSTLRMARLQAAMKLTATEFNTLKADGMIPSPYNFDVCSIHTLDDTSVVIGGGDAVNDCKDAGEAKVLASQIIIGYQPETSEDFWRQHSAQIWMLIGFIIGGTVYMAVRHREENKDDQYVSIDV